MEELIMSSPKSIKTTAPKQKGCKVIAESYTKEIESHTARLGLRR